MALRLLCLRGGGKHDSDQTTALQVQAETEVLLRKGLPVYAMD